LTTKERPSFKRLVPDNEFLRTNYSSLSSGDVFIGRVRLKPSEEHLLLDLLERGVEFFPAALAQLTSRSKVMQATIFRDFMIPDTTPVHDLHDLMKQMGLFSRNGHTRVVTKADRANAGMGINLWLSMEEVFNQASLGILPFPFVIQPFVPDCRDIRVIILSDCHQEAYWRENDDNFRNNLHFDGHSSPADLTREHLQLCHEVMARGKFPYAHIDLLITPDNRSYLCEINLRGGIKGAVVSPDEYREIIDTIHTRFHQQAGL